MSVVPPAYSRYGAYSRYDAYSNALVSTGEESTALYLHPSVYKMRQNSHTEAIGAIAGSRAALICLFSGLFVVPRCFKNRSFEVSGNLPNGHYHVENLDSACVEVAECMTAIISMQLSARPFLKLRQKESAFKIPRYSWNQSKQK